MRGFDRAAALLDAAVSAGRIPGGVLAARDQGGARRYHFTGHASLLPTRRTMTRDTVFDLASPTKVLFTTRRILDHAEAGRIALDAPLGTVLDDAAGAVRGVSFADCLAHRTGFPATWPLYARGDGPAALRAFVLGQDWPRGDPVYSDLNFILLGIALERIEGRSILSMPPRAGLTFAPDPADCAATEACPWRGRILCGEVHDENAFALEGAGHAGLFGTAAAVLAAGETLLDLGPDHPERRRMSARRGIGWEARHDGWPGGDGASEAARGHTGFTGTGVWVDPARGLAWALLTNRVHPSRHAESGIDALRRAVGDALTSGAP
ncbi:class A beta-lactamase-related serine hydrolase [Palleronia sediminis]|uniref:Class A beta-lactamase-related serine hydrolase n=1 Tax=Palleronia sediminis TaxID=2547833 RepID=A0A4R6AJI5_9RHOB|nr:serine hydrolase domain-containing protein [Palleronia sediminis]TDL83505.1 class A beta-lactamase-related serine hydrolase [Palleronia sediminis]